MAAATTPAGRMRRRIPREGVPWGGVGSEAIAVGTVSMSSANSWTVAVSDVSEISIGFGSGKGVGKEAISVGQFSASEAVS
jgi:hypothetical protein